MRAHVIAVSIGAHAVVVGGLLALPRHAAPSEPEVRDIEVVAAPTRQDPPPPPARTEPMRDRAPTRVRKAATVRVARAPVSTEEPGPGSGSGSSSGSGTGSGSGSSSGSGTGTGSGSGSGVDRSGPPVPIDASAARTLPYTAEATRDHVHGDVVVAIEVDPLGHVARASVQRGLGHGLDEIATGIAMQFRFRPATDRSGTPISGRVRWRFHFQPP